MAGIFHPSRGGTRGGQDQFNWEDVKSDKDREYYLGHTLKAPVGKWQEGKDLMWYTRDVKKGDAETEEDMKRKKEIKDIKDVEARAMAAALGRKSHSSGATSLTAKELQEVLSRGQSDPANGVGINGGKTIKEKKVMEGIQTKEAVDAKLKRSKKRKKEKRKKKKKSKKKRQSDDANSDSSYEEVTRSTVARTHPSQQQSQSFANRGKRPSDNDVMKKKRQPSDSDTSERGDRRGCRREINNTRHKYEREEYDRKRGREKEINAAKKRKVDYRNCSRDTSDSNDDKIQTNRTKNKHKLVKSSKSKYSSDNGSSGSTDNEYSHKAAPRNKIRQPADSHVQFTPRNKRPRHDSSSEESD